MSSSYGFKDLTGLGKFGVISQGFGVVSGIIGAMSSASAEKYKTKSLALSLEHKKDMALFNQKMKEAASNGMKGILEYSEEPLVSCDIVGNPHSSVFDSLSTMVNGKMVKCMEKE